MDSFVRLVEDVEKVMAMAKNKGKPVTREKAKEALAQAEASAAKQEGIKDKWAYITGIVKKILKLD